MTDTLHPLNLNTALATVAAVLHVCAGIPGANPQQVNQPFVFPEVNPLGGAALPSGGTPLNTGAVLTYDVISLTEMGMPENRGEYDPDVSIAGDTYEPDPDDPEARLGGIVANVSGNRLLTLQVRCEVRAGDSAGPFTYLERIRTRLGLDGVIASLDAVGLAANTIGASRPADFKDDSGLWVRCAFLEIVFNAADCAADDPVTTIEQLGQMTEDPPIGV